jgi:hypothetical protein
VVARVAAVRVRVTPQTSPQKQGTRLAAVEAMHPQSPALELSFYEKQLMGVLLKGRRLKIHGIGTIPQ